MKKILIILFIIFCCPYLSFSELPKNIDPSKTDTFIKNYRMYPFQWIFPEYYYKAKTIRINKETAVPKGYSKINFFGLSACVPTQYTHKIERRQDILYFIAKDKRFIMMIKSPESSALCSEENQNIMKDYCSAFTTSQEYNHKLFTLTPETANSIGEKWIVHDKGGVFENTKKIEIYSADMFIAYAKQIKDKLVDEKKIGYSHEIVLYHSNGPLNSFITISFLSKNDQLLKQLLSTIE